MPDLSEIWKYIFIYNSSHKIHAIVTKINFKTSLTKL